MPDLSVAVCLRSNSNTRRFFYLFIHAWLRGYSLIFFKYWNPREGRLRYIGHLVFKPTTRVKTMVEEAHSRFLPKMWSDEIETLEELKSDKIENLRYTMTVELDVKHAAQLMDKEVELQSGDIIVIQPITRVRSRFLAC
jgi:hypothetical protein